MIFSNTSSTASTASSQLSENLEFFNDSIVSSSEVKVETEYDLNMNARKNNGNRIMNETGMVKLSIPDIAVTKAIARISPGTAKKISQILIITSSVLPPKYPLILPTIVPIVTVSIATVIPIFKETREPYNTLLNISCP